MNVNLSIFNNSQRDQNQSIFDLEKEVLAMPQIPLEPEHYFAEGLYARELWMPKGSVVTGKAHVKDHLVIIIFGHVTVASDEGTIELKGPCTFVGKAGSKRALYMHEDTLWTAIHSTDKITVEECEETLVTNDPEKIMKISEATKCLIG